MGANEVTDLSRFGLADDPRACASAATVAVPPRPTAGPDESTVSGALHGVYTAELIGITECRPVVLLPQRTAALTGRSIVDLHGDHIGRQVVVMFDGGRPDEPIVMGWVRDTRSATVLRGGEAPLGLLQAADAGEMAHRIKGAARGIGAFEVAAAAETLALASGRDAVHEAVENLCEAIRLTRLEIAEILSLS